MTRFNCTTSTDELLAWWLGELDEAADQRLDEHLFACATCARRLDALVSLGDAIRRETLRGEFGFVATAAFIGRMKQAGLTVREYTVGPGGSVNCTIAPGDDFVTATLTARLTGISRLDVLIDDEILGKARLMDVPFDPVAGALTVVPSSRFLRTLSHARQCMTLVAVEEAQERVIGSYTFNHSPSRVSDA